MGIGIDRESIGRALGKAKTYAGNALREGWNCAQGLDHGGSIAKKVFNVFGPIALSAGGIPGKLAGAMGGFGAYDSLKSEAVGRANQTQDVAGRVMQAVK